MTNKSATPLIQLESQHTINGIAVGTSIESAERIKNASFALHALIETHDLSEHEVGLMLKVVFPQMQNK